MQYLSRYLLFAGIALMAVGTTSPAAAQKIHRYGGVGSEQAVTGSTVGTQGAPVQAAPAPTNTANAADGASQREGDESPLGPSHTIRMAAGNNLNAAAARTTLDLAIDKLYRGIIPGKRDEVAHLSRARESGQNTAHRNELTWIGFHPEADYTRVFFQTARKATYNIRRKQNPAVIEVIISDTEIPAKNFSRFIDTSFFGRNVKRVEANKVDASTVKISIDLGTFEQPTVRESGNYIYLDFPNLKPNASDENSARADGDARQPVE